MTLRNYRFLWVSFQLQDILMAISDDEIRQVLNNLPKNLEKTYERILKKITALGRASLIQRIFKTIICARRPLQIEEILEAITIEPTDKQLPEAKIPTNGWRVVQVCLNLVVVVDDNTLRLAHKTVQRFLLSLPDSSPSLYYRCDRSQANRELGETFVTYLSFPDFETQLVRRDPTMDVLASAIKQNHPLQEGSATATRIYSLICSGAEKGKSQRSQVFNYMHYLDDDENKSATTMRQKISDYISEYWLFQSTLHPKIPQHGTHLGILYFTNPSLSSSHRGIEARALRDPYCYWQSRQTIFHGFGTYLYPARYERPI
jgi:hypothetical protein